MTPSRRDQVETLYLIAREKGLHTIRDAPEDLRREVEARLTQEAGATVSTAHPQPSPGPIRAGMVLGPYRIDAPVGSGGMGQVFRATDTRLDRAVAIKTSHTPFDPRFQREARAIAALNHPNVCTLYDVGPDYLVMELCEGETLAARLNRGKLPIAEAVKTGAQIASSLAAAHGAGIVHRDLKPGNVMLTPHGVKVLDFGLAKTSADDSLTASHVLLGTPAYMAPEQYLGQPAGPRSDLFALGLILYEMASGERPFPGASAGSVLAAGKASAPRLGSPAPVPEEYAGLVEKLLARDPAERGVTAQQAAESLVAIATRLGTSPPIPSRGLRVASAVVAIVLASAAYWLFLRTPRPAEPDAIEQITSFPDSAVHPAFSPDGRMLTFIRGRNSMLAGDGQVYVKLLPNGEPVQLTNDRNRKMDPVFSPDGTRIAYTTSRDNANWDTWQVPTSGGQAKLWLPNTEGLHWLDRTHLIYSEIMGGIHMAVVTAPESRMSPRVIYSPPDMRGMAHRARVSPDRKSVLIAEMDQYGWLPCRLMPFDGSNAGVTAGPPVGSCTEVAWSPDGKWMYFTSDSSGTTQIWRQAFPDGRPESVTRGPMEAAGLAVSPDGKSLVTSMGINQTSIWISGNGEPRQISGEGTARFPAFGDGYPTSVFSPDGKRIFYLVKNGPDLSFAGGELYSADIATGVGEVFLPGVRITSFDFSPDGRQLTFATISPERRSRIWIAPLSRRSSPRELNTPDAIGPVFGPANNLFFRAREGNQNYLFEINLESNAIRKFGPDPGINAPTISPDRKWIVSVTPANLPDASVAVKAYPASGGPGFTVCNGICFLRWTADSRSLFLSFDSPNQNSSLGTTVLIPLAPGRAFPPLPALGLAGVDAALKLPGARAIRGSGLFPGLSAGTYAYSELNIQRNLFRLPLR